MAAWTFIWLLLCRILFAFCSSGKPFVYGSTTTAPCTVTPELPSAGQAIADLANDGKQLVKIQVTFKGENNTDPMIEDRFSRWVVSTSVTGQSMLMLKEYFDAMSLYTLGLSVANYEVVLNQNPSKCLSDKNPEDIDTIMRNGFLTGFGASDYTLPAGAEICNKRVTKEDETHLNYVCCKINAENKLECAGVVRTTWITLLFASILILQIVIILYSPLHLPDFMYKANSIFQTYIYTAEADKPLKFNVKLIAESSTVDNGYIKAEVKDFTHLRKLKSQIETLEPGKVHKFAVKGIDVCVRDSKIVCEGDAPVSFLGFLRNFIVRCKLRYEIKSVSDCCNENMWVLLPCNIVFRWYQCMTGVMMLLAALFFTIPWLLRIWFYYSIEKKEVDYQKHLNEKYNITRPYPGNLVTYVSPTHALFMTIHILFVVEVIAYILIPGNFKDKLKFTVRKCFRDTRDKSKTDACGIMASHMLQPLKRFGIVGCLLMPLWFIVLPLYLIFVLLEVIPILNLSVRLLMNLFFYITKVINPNIFRSNDKQVPSKLNTWMKKRFGDILVVDEYEENSRLNKFLHFIAIIMTFITMWFFLIILIECIAFYVECFVYVLIGFILDPRTVFKYVSLTLLILVYGNESFSGVHNRYAAYSTAINGEVQDMVGEKMTHEASKSIDVQENTAFRVPPKVEAAPERVCLTTDSEGFLKWRVFRLVLFLDKSDIPYIPTSFLFKMGQLSHFQCPGLVHKLYFSAFINFLWIILFLAFVFIVIFAFGQANDISSAGQAIAALATGFFPLILKKFLFKPQDYSVDRSNLNWKNMFANALQVYSESWSIADVTLTEAEGTEMGDKNLENDSITEINEINKVDKTKESEMSEDHNAVTKDHQETAEDDNVDLIVRRGSDSSMTFYVPYTPDDTETEVFRDEETVL